MDLRAAAAIGRMEFSSKDGAPFRWSAGALSVALHLAAAMLLLSVGFAPIEIRPPPPPLVATFVPPPPPPVPKPEEPALRGGEIPRGELSADRAQAARGIAQAQRQT